MYEYKTQRVLEWVQREPADREVLEDIQIRVCILVGQDGIEGDQGEDQGMGGILQQSKETSGIGIQNTG